MMRSLDWETDTELMEAARWRYHNDAEVHAIADTASMIAVPDSKDGNRSMTIALREVAIQAVCVALLIRERHESPAR